MAQATAHGWRKTVGAAFAPLLSDGPIILIVLIVLSQTPDWFLRALNIAGGIFLLYLAYGAFKTFRTYSGAETTKTAEANFFKAALMNTLSPGPWIYWSVLAGPILIEAWGVAPVNALLFLLGFYLLLIGGNILFIALFAGTRKFGANVTRILNGVAAVALAIFGLLQLYRGVA